MTGGRKERETDHATNPDDGMSGADDGARPGEKPSGPPVAAPPASESPEGFYAFSLALVKVAARLFLRLGAAQVSGRDRIPAHGGFIFASNHASHFDPPVLAVASPRPLTFLAKIELFRNRLFAGVIRNLGAFPIQRGKGDTRAMETALAFLAAGHALVVFPEGTRTLTGKIGRIRTGAARLSIRAGVPIVPAFIEGTYAAFPKHGKPRPGRVRVRIGEPLRPEGLEDTAADCAKLTARLEESLKTLERAGSRGGAPEP